MFRKDRGTRGAMLDNIYIYIKMKNNLNDSTIFKCMRKPQQNDSLSIIEKPGGESSFRSIILHNKAQNAF